MPVRLYQTLRITYSPTAKSARALSSLWIFTSPSLTPLFMITISPLHSGAPPTSLATERFWGSCLWFFMKITKLCILRLYTTETLASWIYDCISAQHITFLKSGRLNWWWWLDWLCIGTARGLLVLDGYSLARSIRDRSYSFISYQCFEETLELLENLVGNFQKTKP